VAAVQRDRDGMPPHPMSRPRSSSWSRPRRLFTLVYRSLNEFHTDSRSSLNSSSRCVRTLFSPAGHTTGKAQFFRNRFYVFDPFCDYLAYCFRMVLLQVVKTRAKMYDSTVAESFRKAAREYRRDQCTGISHEKQLGIRRPRQCHMCALDRGVHISRFSGDWQLVRKAPGRKARLRSRKRRSVDCPSFYLLASE